MYTCEIQIELDELKNRLEEYEKDKKKTIEKLRTVCTKKIAEAYLNKQEKEELSFTNMGGLQPIFNKLLSPLSLVELCKTDILYVFETIIRLAKEGEGTAAVGYMNMGLDPLCFITCRYMRLGDHFDDDYYQVLYLIEIEPNDDPDCVYYGETKVTLYERP
jgi:hypothetical protein